MEDLSLEALRARLNAAQSLAVGHLFQERNAVELMTKLQARGLVAALHSLDGTEYITAAALQREVVAELRRQRGRLNCWEAAPLLNVEGGQVQAAVQRILKDQPELQLIGGDLLAPEYFDDVAREAADLLRQAGRVALVDLANRFRLPLTCVTDAVRSRLGTLLHATLEDGVLYTPALLRQHCHSLKGALYAAAYPSSLLEVAARHALPDKLLPTVLQMLLDEGDLPGTLEGGLRGLFVPNRFEAARQRAVRDFYQENSYVDYARLKAWGVANPAQYVRSVCHSPRQDGKDGTDGDTADDGVALSGHFVSAALLRSLVSQLEAVVPSQPCVPIGCHLPMDLGPRDTEEVWQWCARVSPLLARQCELHAGHLVQPAVLRPTALEKAELAAEADVKRGQRRAGASSGAPPPAEPQRRQGRDRRVADKAKDSGVVTLPAVQAVAIVRGALPTAAQQCEPLAEALAAAWLPALSTAYAARAERLTLGPEEQRRARRAALQQQMDVLWQDLHLYRRGLASFARHNDKEADQLLQRHLLDTVAAQLVHCLVLDNALANGDEPAPDAPLEKLLPLFPKPQRAALSELVDAVATGNVSRFVAEVEGLQGSCDVCLRLGDKRRERQHQQRRRRELFDRLRDGTLSAADLWLTAGLCLYARYFHLVLWAPAELAPHLPPALAELQREPPPASRLLHLLAEAEPKPGVEPESSEGQALHTLREELTQLFGSDDGP